MYIDDASSEPGSPGTSVAPPPATIAEKGVAMHWIEIYKGSVFMVGGAGDFSGVLWSLAIRSEVAG